jgi:hypothetical protein
LGSRVGVPDPSGLVGLEQLQAVLQGGGETWGPSPFWQVSSTFANGCPLASLGEQLGPEDHVPLLLAVASWPNLGFLLLVSTCLFWEGRQEAPPCLSVVLVVSLSISPPGLGVSWCLSSCVCALPSLPPFPASRRSPRCPGGRRLAPPWTGGRGLAWGGRRGDWEGAFRLLWLEVTRSRSSYECLPAPGSHQE